MKVLLLMGGVKEARIWLPNDEVVVCMSIKDLRDAKIWMQHVHTLWLSANAIYSLQSPAIWSNYLVLGNFENHREVQLLKERLLPMRKAYNGTKPLLLKKKYVATVLKAHRKEGDLKCRPA